MIVLPFSEITKRPDATAGSALLCAERILVCLRYGIGEVVMELPLLDTLRRVAPKAHITAIGAAPAIEVLEGPGLVDEIVTYGRWGIRHFWDSCIEDTESSLLLWLKQAEFDVVLTIRGRGIPSLSTDEPVLEAALARGGNCAEALAVAARSGWELPVNCTVKVHPESVIMALHEMLYEVARERRRC